MAVSIGGIACESIAYLTNHTQLLCDTAFTTGADYEVLITTDGLTSEPGIFSFSPPIVDTVQRAPAVGGTITITGNYFGPAPPSGVASPLVTVVTLGSSSCLNPVVTVSETTLICTVQEQLTLANGGTFALADLEGDGFMDVVVSIGGQGSGVTGKDKFEFTPCIVTAVTPQSDVYYTDAVTIAGTNFGNAAGAYRVKVGALSALQVEHSLEIAKR